MKEIEIKDGKIIIDIEKLKENKKEGKVEEKRKKRVSFNAKIHYMILMCGVAIMLYLIAEIKIHIVMFKIAGGIAAAAMVHQVGYVILFTTALLLTFFVVYAIAKWMIFDVLFPMITIVDERKNKMRFKRAIWKIKDGWLVKFRLFPLFELDKFILDENTIWERKIKDIYVYTNNIIWDKEKKVFKPFKSFIPSHFENITDYRFMLGELNELIGKEVGKAVAGDPFVRKEKFEEGLPNPKEE